MYFLFTKNSIKRRIFLCHAKSYLNFNKIFFHELRLGLLFNIELTENKYMMYKEHEGRSERGLRIQPFDLLFYRTQKDASTQMSGTSRRMQSDYL